MIAVHADTMALSNVVGEPGDAVKVDVNVRNFLPLKEITVPFTWAGSANLTLDSFSTAGLRTSYFEQQSLQGYQPVQKKATIYLNCSSSGAQPYLAVGTGSVVSLWFSIPPSAPSTTNPIKVLDTANYYYHPTFMCVVAEYQPTVRSGSVQVKRNCCIGPTVGNVDMSADNLVTMGDLTVLIDHLFISLAALTCPVAGNVDLSVDGLVTMSDLTVLIDNLFITLSPLPPCP
jgi:hypothetical protein